MISQSKEKKVFQSINSFVHGYFSGKSVTLDLEDVNYVKPIYIFYHDEKHNKVMLRFDIYEVYVLEEDFVTAHTPVNYLLLAVHGKRVCFLKLSKPNFETFSIEPLCRRLLALYDPEYEYLLNDDDLEYGYIPADPDPAVTDPAASDPAASDPAASDPAASDPADPDPAASDPADPDPADPDPVVTDPAASDPADPDPADPDPAVTDSAASDDDMIRLASEYDNECLFPLVNRLFGNDKHTVITSAASYVRGYFVSDKSFRGIAESNYIGSQRSTRYIDSTFEDFVDIKCLLGAEVVSVRVVVVYDIACELIYL